jgi:hypothetical protein
MYVHACTHTRASVCACPYMNKYSVLVNITLTLRFRACHICPGRYLNPPLYFAAYTLIQVGKVYISNLLHVRGHF